MITEIPNSVQSVALARSIQQTRQEKQPAESQGQTEATVRTQNNVQKVDFYQQNQAKEQQAKQEEVSLEQVERNVEQTNQAAQNANRTLNFSVERDTGRIIIKVIDTETDEVIREIPPEDVKRVSGQFKEDNLTGVLLRAEV